MNERERCIFDSSFFVLTWCHGSLEIFTHTDTNIQHTNKTCIVGSRVSFSDNRNLASARERERVIDIFSNRKKSIH